ncbi:MAG TPA: 16S rRNA (cytidine(1402)-2'-O)-methyltransferase [Euzebyales bacterium]
MDETRAPDGGRIVLVATPIGNLADLSPRALAALTDADVVAAEDTRRTGRLLSHHGLARPLVRLDDHTERARAAELVRRAADGQIVAVATDAGTPGISDPGYVMVRAAIDAGVPVELIPGPVAAVHALVLSGLPTDRFVFEGFLPRRPRQRRDHIAGLADERRTIVCYLSPHRAADELDDLAAVLGPRPAALARELTKLHEQIMRAPLDELAATVRRVGVRGELTIVVAGAPIDADHRAAAELDDAELVDRVRGLIATGMARNAAVAAVARATGLPRSRVYDATVTDRRR